MGVRNLTDRFCSSITEPGKYRDNRRQGLFLQVHASGSKNWGQILRVKGSAEKPELGLGGYPTISLSDARELASQNHAKARRGLNPKASKEIAKSIPNFREVAEQAIKNRQHEWRSFKTKKQWEANMQTYAYPVIGELTVDQITIDHILRILKPIWLAKPVTAEKVMRRIKMALDYAIHRKLRSGPNTAAWEVNLEFELPRHKNNPVHQPALQQKDAPRWWRALLQREGMAQKALQIVILSASRGGEVRKMAWEQIEQFDEAYAQKSGFSGIWMRPANLMKIGEADEAPITHYMMKVMRNAGTSSGLVFPSPITGKELSENALNKLMKDMHSADLEGGFFDRQSKKRAVSHGLRSTFSDWAGEHKIDREVAEKQLAHKIGNASQQAYFRTQLLALRAEASNAFLTFLSQ